MGNFEKLSVLVIGVIIVMILVVALYTWTDDPADGPTDPKTTAGLNAIDAGPPAPGTGGQAKPYMWDTWNTPPPPKDVTNAPKSPASSRASVPAASATTPPAATPPGSAQAMAPAPAGERKVVVKEGDTLGHISQRVYGTVKHWPKIAARNDVRPESLRAGMELIIPEIETTSSSSAAATGDPAPAAGASAGGLRPTAGSSYRVRSGDTIEKIAKAAYGTIERWPDIWLENMERIENPNDLPTGIEIEIP